MAGIIILVSCVISPAAVLTLPLHNAAPFYSEEERMFGYVMADVSSLSDGELAVYRSYYCGLCRALGRRGGSMCRLTLTYDMTFLAVLLSSLYCEEEELGHKRCSLHPRTDHPFVVNDTIDYCADMNIMLTYYNLLDDWHDDKNISAALSAAALKKVSDGISDRYPRQSRAAAGALAELSEAERRGELNPDVPAACFGRLLAEIFAMHEDEYAQRLRRLGFSLGKFIYILDAFVDLKSDLRRRKYNPLSGVVNVDRNEILTALLADCADAYEALGMTRNRGIVDNVLYSGVWLRADKGRRPARRGRKSNGSGSV